MNANRDERGLTLVEVLIASVLMTLVIFASFLLYERGVKDWLWTEQETEVVDNLRIAVAKVTYDVRGATTITVPAVYESDVASLALVNSNGQTVVYQYDAAAQELERSVAGGTYQPVTSGVVTAVYFSRPAPALVQVLLKGKGVQTSEVSVRTAVYARSL
jgi:type II secretory pathway component PulJ